METLTDTGEHMDEITKLLEAELFSLSTAEALSDAIHCSASAVTLEWLPVFMKHIVI